MKIILHILTILSLFQGCLYVNERGITNQYYSDCEEYYDSEGFYRKSCDENLVDYKDVKNTVQETAKKVKELVIPEHGVKEYKFGF